MESRHGTRSLPAHNFDLSGHRRHAGGEFYVRVAGQHAQREAVMKWIRAAAIIFLLAIAGASLLANFIAPSSYAYQFRADPGASPSRQHLLGTDDLGRDRLSRLLYGTRVSLLLAPAAAFLSSLLGLLIGGFAGFVGGWTERL